VTRAAITGGRVLQAASHTVVVDGGAKQRQPWAHYLARPGVVELTGRGDRGWAALGDGYLGPPQPGTIDLGALNERILDDIVVRPELNRRPPFRAQRTVLRWAAEATDTAAAAGPPAAARFSLVTGTLRTARRSVPSDLLPAVLEFCADVALHDWLLTTVVGLIEHSREDASGSTAAVQRIRPAVEHLLHLWMPAARVDRRLLPLWESLERRPGFTRQWDVSVTRIRDQIAMTTVSLLAVVAEGLTQPR
jgi:hypothetical protein